MTVLILIKIHTMTLLKIKKLIFLLILFNSSAGLCAQNGNVATGDDISGAGGGVNYSIGQLAYKALSGTMGNINQGLQQAYEIFTVGYHDQRFNISLSVYPNPVSDNLIISMHEFGTDKFYYEMSDMNGKRISSDKITAANTIIDVRILPASSYLCNIIKENKIIKSFKIIKN